MKDNLIRILSFIYQSHGLGFSNSLIEFVKNEANDATQVI